MSLDYSSSAFEEKYTYHGELGAAWSREQTAFRVWAPTASQVFLNLYAAGDGGEGRQTAMTADVCGTWVCAVPGDLNGVYYTYTAVVDGIAREACDPYARTCGVNGQRAMVMDLSSADPAGWEQDCDPNAGKALADAVLYELHIRDLSMDAGSGIAHKGKYLGLTEIGTVNRFGQSTGLDHLKALGITHLHLLPVYDYGSVDETRLHEPQFNWGYDPVNYNVPEGSYATDPYHGEVRVREFKQMVKALHDSGISVVMDVVYNHVFDADTFCFNRLVPGYFSRGASNGSFCGNDTASERSMVRKFIVDSVCYWAEEYHIDGFRFDLVGLLDVETVNAIVSAVHQRHPDVIFYGEGWEMPTVPTKQVKLATQKNSHLTPGFAYFSDTLRDLLRGSVWDDKELGFVSGRKGLKPLLDKCMMGLPDWCVDPAQSINYASCHDNMTLFDRIAVSLPNASRETVLRMNNLAAAIYMTAQGIPFIHAGEELLRTKNFDHNSYKSPDSVNSIKWDTLCQSDVQQTLAYYQGLIRLRKRFPALRQCSAEGARRSVLPVAGLPEHTAAYGLKGEQELFIIFHAGTEEIAIDLPAGHWQVLVYGDTAGYVPLFTAERTISVPPISAAVLVKSEFV